MSTPKDVLKAERLARIEPHQFKKGESPNPGGRPKGAVSIKKLLTDAIHKIDPKDADGRTHAEKLVQALIDVATRPQGQASIKAIGEIFDRLEGKAVQAITVSPLDQSDRKEREDRIMEKLARLKALKESGNDANVQ